jgi:predicted RecA/RadA family phage recombinase
VTDPDSGTAYTGTAVNYFLFAPGPARQGRYRRGTGRAPVLRSFVLDRGQWGIGWDVNLDIGVQVHRVPRDVQGQGQRVTRRLKQPQPPVLRTGANSLPLPLSRPQTTTSTPFRKEGSPMGESTYVNQSSTSSRIAVAALAAGQVIQDYDGKAGVVAGLNAVAVGDVYTIQKTGKIEIAKTATMVILKGGKVFWDHSANKAHYKAVNDRDFYVGVADDDAASAATTVVVDLNVEPAYLLDVARDPVRSVLVGTQALGGFGLLRRGGAHNAIISATNEAQKIDIITTDGFANGANAIVEAAFTVPSDGAGTVVDVSIGIANATHATDADSITESVFVHLDANNTNINLESDDGTTEVAATDSTLDYTEGSTNAERVEVWFDMRDPADVQIYVNGVLALAASVFNVNVAAGPWKLLLHIEKTATTDTYELDLHWLRARIAEN